jgi:hypothetical protein
VSRFIEAAPELAFFAIWFIKDKEAQEFVIKTDKETRKKITKSTEDDGLPKDIKENFIKQASKQLSDKSPYRAYLDSMKK